MGFTDRLHVFSGELDAKIKRICALYPRAPEGSRVICVDEKTCIQALERNQMPSHTRCQPAPFLGSISTVLVTLVDAFGWALDDIG